MIDLRRKYIRVKTKYEYEDIMKHAEKQGFKVTKKYPNIIFPTVVHFWNDYNVTDNASHISENLIIDYSELKPEMTAREFLEKLIKHLDCDGRCCEDCKFYSLNNLMRKTLCSVSYWKKDDINYLIELVSADDPIYHPPMDNVRAANFIDDVLGGKKLSKDEEEALKYAAEKLRKMKENE